MSIADIFLRMAGAKCPRCGYQLRAADLKAAQVANEFACPSCKKILKAARVAVAPAKLDKSHPQATLQVKTSQGPGEYRLSVRWYSPQSHFIFVFAALWNALILFIGYLVIFHANSHQNEVLPLVILSIFGLVGVLVAHAALCEAFNTSYVVLKSGQIQFWTSPLSVSGKRSFPRSEIGNLSLERVDGGSQNDKKIFRHYVKIHPKGGPAMRLCRVQSLNEGIYVQSLLEQQLGLVSDASLDQIAN